MHLNLTLLIFIFSSFYAERHHQLHIWMGKLFYTVPSLQLIRSKNRIHTVFGRVISGIEIVKVIEDLPVDRNSRPLDEVMVKSCGELVRQTKGD